MNDFMTSLIVMAKFCNKANVINMPELVLIFPDRREQAYFEARLKMEWNMQQYGLLDIENIQMHGLRIKFRVKANLPKDFEIIKK